MSELTREEALQIAAMYGLTTEIKYAIGCGQSPEQALRDWDIIKEDEIEIISGSEDKIPPAATNPDVKDGDDVEIIYREEIHRAERGNKGGYCRSSCRQKLEES